MLGHELARYHQDMEERAHADQVRDGSPHPACSHTLAVTVESYRDGGDLGELVEHVDPMGEELERGLAGLAVELVDAHQRAVETLERVRATLPVILACLGWIRQFPGSPVWQVEQLEPLPPIPPVDVGDDTAMSEGSL